MDNYGDSKHFQAILGGELIINEHWGIGAAIQYDKTKSKNESFGGSYDGIYDTRDNSIFTTQISLNHYIQIIPKLYYFTSLNLGLAYNKEARKEAYQAIQIDNNPPDADYYHDEYKYKYTLGSLKPNLIYFMTEKVALQASLGGISYKKYHDSDNSDFSFSLNPTLWSFGFVLAL